nr:apoptosis-associated speck-like protein containing a CARD [Pelodiscus sinensis]XP_025042002.1 apoptosis-associated speck-like protein containing a CARD [Pelodiscus sinensis]XP_025042006.1 apoptosis-associated speck-like protein containing a CARD [Pelodiscus sinensis]XP_025042009.1 apoptosis-associated speck-like protein containing a CARD [Pelodiscus sinensis]XP_025042012.1 apoptosis-associated speck-like protein containing a CARD [Pelodiscus sinensis]|eukprot:XP_014430687.1 apoptosis-associated speck-like protein containing a CARD [Pelodiscus sinensis]
MENKSRISDLLVSALDDLCQADLKRFKDKLSHSAFEGKRPIPRGLLENADRIDTKNLLMEFYGGAAAVEVTINVLTQINLRESAAKLRAESEKGERAQKQIMDPFCEGRQSGRSCGSPDLSSGRGSFPTPIWSGAGEHFVSRHRVELIQRVCMVDSIIDMLRGTVLDEEQYESIRAEKTNPEKMRKLYEFMPSWNWDCKERLYQALKAKHKFLIAELERK